jgi:hypothetical protein
VGGGSGRGRSGGWGWSGGWGRSGGGWRGRPAGGAVDVGLDDPAAGAGALHRGEIDAALLGEAAGERLALTRSPEAAAGADACAGAAGGAGGEDKVACAIAASSAGLAP